VLVCTPHKPRTCVCCMGEQWSLVGLCKTPKWLSVTWSEVQHLQCLYVERNLRSTVETSQVRVVPAAARIPCPAGLFRLAASNMGCFSKHNHPASGLHWGVGSQGSMRVCECSCCYVQPALPLCWAFRSWPFCHCWCFHWSRHA
jgi:hypothetical protein